MRHRRQWTPEEVDALRLACERVSAQASGPLYWRLVARALGRLASDAWSLRWQSVRQKAWRIGIRAKVKAGSRSASRWHTPPRRGYDG